MHRSWLLVLLLAACSLTKEQQPLRAEVNLAGEPTAEPSERAAAPLAGPEGYLQVEVGGVIELGEGHALVLVHGASKRFVPVFLGGTEGLSIALRVSERRYPRPLTHDLFDAALGRLDARVHSARIVKLEGGVYFATLVLESKGTLVELDARTSDAVAMAVGNDAPIYVRDEVLDEAGMSLDRTEPVPLTEPIPTGVPL